MKTILLLALIALAVIVLTTSTGHCNGMAVYEVPGNSVIPMQQNDIRLLKEKVIIINKDYGTIITTTDNDFDVTATFLFENTSSKKTTIQMGFPFTKDTEPPSRSFLGEKKRGVFTHYDKNFVVTVDGKEIRTEKKKVTQNIKLNIGSQYDYAFVWEVTFAPKEKKEVRCSYDVEWEFPEPSSLSGSFRYITKTGALWHGNISEASFSIKVDKLILDEIKRKETKLEIKPKGYKLRNNQFIEWEFKNWKPTEDIEIKIQDIRKDRRK